jgi:hypothetical protein
MSLQARVVKVRCCIRRRLPHAIAFHGVLWFVAHAACAGGEPDRFTLSDWIRDSYAVVFVERGPETGPQGKHGPTTYRVLEICKDDLKLTSTGADLQVDVDTDIQPGGTGLLLGMEKDEVRSWIPFQAISRSAWDYICKLPQNKLTDEERAAHFTAYLAHDERLVSGDALTQLIHVEIPLVAKHVDDAMHARLSERVAQKAVSPMLRDYYGHLLGLIGDDDDRRLLRDLALRETSDYRIEGQGMITGYMALAGEQGLKELEEQKLFRPDVVFSEQLAVVNAVKFCSRYVPERIPRVRLGQTLLLLTDRPELCDLGFAHLMRMNDWRGIEKVLPIYEAQPTAPSTKRVMIRYLHVAAHPELANVEKPTPAQQTQATGVLETLRKREPELFDEALKFFQPKQIPTADSPMT